MSTQCYILTNNPLVSAKYPQMAKHIGHGVGAVLQAARDEIHLGAILINHPLSGSIGIGETPCKSLLLRGRRGALDMASLKLIESALEAFRQAPPGSRELPPDIARDFQVIDLDLLDCAVKTLSAR